MTKPFWPSPLAQRPLRKEKTVHTQKTIDGQTAKLISAICQALPHGLTTKRIQQLIDKPYTLKYCLRELMEDSPTLQPLEFVFDVDYSIPLKLLLEGIDYATEEMRELKIPINILPIRKKVTCVLLKTGGKKISAEIANWMAREGGYRPASIRELLIWGKANTNILEQLPVAATAEPVSPAGVSTAYSNVYLFLHKLVDVMVLDHIGYGGLDEQPLIDDMFEKGFGFLLTKNTDE